MLLYCYTVYIYPAAYTLYSHTLGTDLANQASSPLRSISTRVYLYPITAPSGPPNYKSCVLHGRPTPRSTMRCTDGVTQAA